MPEIRKDPVTDTWVIIAAERCKRPTDFAPPKEVKKGGFCPFCYGNEDKTPPEVMAYRPDHSGANEPGWTVRVVPNKFPALESQGDPRRSSKGMFELINGVGAHEVIVETPEHDATLGSSSRHQVEEVIWALRERYLALQKDPRLKFTQIFKNQGPTAGASLEHPHFQIISTPIVPVVIQEELHGAKRYHDSKQHCIYCDMIQAEKEAKERMVEISSHFAVFCPYASRFPFETWILPLRHIHDFGQISEEEVKDLAAVLKGTMGGIEETFSDLPYNMILHTAPYEAGHETYYHWHLEILPRLTITAGFEWGTGFYINPTSPECAAESFKSARVQAAH